MKLRKRVIIFLFLICFTVLSGCAVTGQGSGLIISEVVSSNGSSFLAEGVGSPDWIELYNGTGKQIDLAGYTLRRSDAAEKRYEFPAGAVIGAGEYLVVSATQTAAEDCAYYATGFNLPKSGCSLKLENAMGMTVDRLDVPQLETDVSYCRVDGVFRLCATPTPGSENAGEFADSLADLEAAEPPVGLRINEANEEFVELYNAGEEPIALAAFSLTDDSAKKAKWRLPYQTLDAGEYLLVSLIGEGELAASFRLSAYETVVYLCYAGEIYDSMDLAGLWEGMSRGIDAAGNSAYYIAPTPGTENGAGLSDLQLREMDAEEPIKLNEIMLKNTNTLIDEDGDRTGWVELFNASQAAVELSDYYLSDDAEELLKWQLPAEMLGAGEYKIIHLSGKDRAEHTSFKVGKNEPLILTNYRELSSMTVDLPEESRLDNVSYGLQDGKWLYFGKGTPGRENTVHGSESIANAEKIDRMSLWITEVSAAGKPEDWVELYNGGETAVTLDGWYLSDDLEEPRKYALSGSIAAKDYCAIAPGSAFGISIAGEELVLTDPLGGVADCFETGALRAGETSGRATGDYSGARVFFDAPTKGAQNAQPKGAQLPAPQFSADGGFYPDGVTVELTAAEGTIYYTLDGSAPTTDSARYTAPLHIAQNTSVSAIAVKEGYLSSNSAVSSYLIEEKPTLPVVCISMDAADFRSVYAVSTWSSDKRKTIERKCNIEYYETDGKLGVSFPCGVRVAGNSTRSYAQKSLALYPRARYGQSNVVYPFFEGSPVTEFQSLVLRNAGQNHAYSRMADTLASNLFQGMNLDTAQSKFVIVYINGAYYGIYDLKEKLNEHYFASYYGVDADSVNLIRRNTLALAGSNTQVKEAYRMAQSLRTASEEGYEKFTQYVDEYAWIDYIIARSYTGDTDIFNQKLWNTNDYTVKWRPVFYDCDFAFAGRSGSTLGIYFKGEGHPSPDGSLTNMYLPTALKRNDAWCEMLVERYADVMKWVPERSLELYDTLYAQLEPEMERHIARWGTPSSYAQWKKYASALRGILQDRPTYVVKQVKSAFGVSDAEMKELFPQYYR